VFLGKGAGLGGFAYSFQVNSQGGQVAKGAFFAAWRLPAMRQTAALRRLVGLVTRVHHERVEGDRVGAMGTGGGGRGRLASLPFELPAARGTGAGQGT